MKMVGRQSVKRFGDGTLPPGATPGLLRTSEDNAADLQGEARSVPAQGACDERGRVRRAGGSVLEG